MNRRQRSRMRAHKSWFSGPRGSSLTRHVTRQLLLEGLEYRRLLEADGWMADDVGSTEDADATEVVGDVSAAVCLPSSPTDLESETAPSVANQILVKLRDDATPSQSPEVLRGPATALALANAFYPLSDVLVAAGAASADPVLPQLARIPAQTGRWPALPGGEAEELPEASEVADRAELGRWYRLDLPAGADLQAALAALGGMAEVEAVETNVTWGLSEEIPPVIEGLPDGTTDPAYGQQWHHSKTRTWKAWDHLNHNGIYPGGTQDVVVAVIDSGVDYHHEELAANMWVNPGEIPDNGIDDDGNGFKDDIHGASVVSNPTLHTGDPIDQHGHGTHVAGIIAAQGFNGKGGVGVAFNVRIMAVRAAQYSGVLTVDDIAEGILYAVDNGAEVINMSFGGYQRSQIIEDALEVALNQAVLVAAAGNDSLWIGEAPFYPAALPYVLGVEASTPDGLLADFSNYGYDIRAPGVSIYSTLPGNQYAAWSGTSMATPVVSGVAALMRSYFWQRDVYSSRFIMGCIAASGDDSETGVVDAYKALTEPPKPGVSLHSTWLFDQTAIDPANDGDGRADAGETLHLGFELINRSGQADHVFAILDAIAPGASQPDPYVEIVSNTVFLQGIGPFAIDDNGLIYDTGGVIIGVEAPWIVKVKPDCPNDHVIPFQVTIYFEDGWDPEHPIYTRLDSFEFIVQRGQNLPPVIGEDMTLTADNFWIVGGPVLVEPGVTLTVEPGAQIQWGAISSDPYNPGPQTGYMIIRGALRVEGTQDDPVEMFPSYLVTGQTVDIRAESGDAQMSYVKVRNPKLTNLYSIDHGYLDWDLYTSGVEAWHITNTIFHKFRGGGSLTANWQYDTVLFDAGWIPPSGGAKINNSVFLQDNENNHPITYSPVVSYDEAWYPSDSQTDANRNLAIEHDGYTYAIVRSGSNQYLQAAELAADYFGGEVVLSPNQDEQNFLMSYWSAWMNQDWGFGREQTSLMGLRPKGAGEFEWPDGSPVYFTSWASAPSKIKGAAHSEGVWFSRSGYYNTMGWYNGTSGVGWYLIRIPGRWTKEQINGPFLDGRIDAYIEERLQGIDRGNAFLSKYWDPTITRWMRVSSPTSNTPLTAHVLLEDNYWGTTSTTLINHAIIDYNDNFTTAHVDYGTPLEHGAETAYPFVDSVLINGIPAEQVPTLGAGPVTYTVHFNRDMDPETQPFVTFGPAAPFTDYSVHPVGGNDAGYNSNAFEFTVRLSQPASETVTVSYATEDGTAQAGMDYVAPSGRRPVEAGEMEKTVAVPILGDIELEPDKDFHLVLSQPTVATIADGLGVGTILDDELTLSIGDVTLWEGNASTTLAVFPVTLSEAASQAVSVSYETADGTAEMLDDYESSRGAVTFQPGETAKTISVPVLGNTVNQPDRNFSVRLTHPRVANLADALGQATIRDDDFLLTSEEVRVVEGDADTRQAVFTVRLSGASEQTVTVDYATADGTAIAGSDYQAASGTLTFAPGVLEQTIALTVAGDTEVEPNETFLVRFSNASGAALVASEVAGVIVGDDGPLFSINDISYVELDSSRANAVFTVTLSANPAAAVTVNYTTPNLGTATLAAVGTLGADYHPATGTLTFNPGGALQQTVSVSVAGDTWAEDHETFLVLLSSTTAAISDHLGQATIVNDDPYFEIEDATLVEGDSGTTNAEFVIRLVDCPAAETVSVNYATVAGTATAGEDFVAQSGTLTFATGQPRQQTITVPILGDTLDETDEGFQILLSAPSGAIIFDYVAQGTITNDDWPTLQVADATLSEGDAGVKEFEFPVRLSRPAAETVTVAWATSDGTATAGDDYQAATGTVTFLPGETEQTVVVDVVGETLNEFDESFTVTLSSPVYATIEDGEAIGTVTDDDNPALSITDVSVVEGAAETTGEAVFTVTLSEASTETVTVNFTTADGSAAAGTDYQTYSGTLTFSPGQTEQLIAVTVVGDGDAEINEMFTVDLSGAVNADLGDAQGAATIVGDDGPLLAISDSQLVEGDTGTSYLSFTVTLSAAAASDVQVSYATLDGTARAGTDYGAVANGVLIFKADQNETEKTVQVPVLGDLQNESDETFGIRLFGATVAGVADGEAVGTIVDDDPTLTVSDLSVTEGSGGQTSIEFTVSVSRRPVASKPVTVSYGTTAGTATAGDDYLQASGTLTFTSDGGDPLDKTVTVLVQGDVTNEVDEDFFVTLSNATGADIAKAQGRATILDDDGPKLLISDATLTEGHAGQTMMEFTVSLSQASAQEISVSYATADGTARAGVDYQNTSGTLIFSPSEVSKPISVPVIGDTLDEVDETVRVLLSGSSGPPIADATGEGTILDDDAATLSVDDVQQTEGFNGWLNSRTWQGVFWVTPMTGESYHQMRISGAVAADDPWLVSGYDVGRFRFQIKTMGVAAMTLQATGQEGSIRLSWAQDDFELLAGYNLYRATSEAGTYTRLNSTIIPVGSEWFVDTNVTPAVPMYYKFTVVQTDMTESDPSNVASAAALDTIPPVITHTPKTSATPGSGLRLTATVTDNVGVEGVAVHYRPRGSTQAYVSLPMVNLSGTSWSVTIPGTAVQPPGVDYYLTAWDDLNTVYHGTAAAPHSVIVTAAPSLTSVSPNQGSVDGGLRVTLSGSQFQAGATVEFGGVAATDVVVQTSSQILCTTPAHFPALVDVRVVNPDASQATLLSGFRYVDEDAVLSLPTMSADHGATVDIPISLAQVDGLRAAQLTVTFDAAVLTIKGVSTGTLTSGWSLAANTATAGRVVLSLAGATASSGDGTLAKLNVEAVGAVASQTALTLSNVLLNDGAIAPDLSNGLFAVNGFFSLSGSVKYFPDNRAVPGAELELVGVGAQSATSDVGGAFSFATVQTGAYTLTPDKEDQVVDITAYDASLILQTVAGTRTLTTNQRLAADVNRDGAVTSMDASYVLEKSVGLLTGLFPGAGRSWVFTPAERTYSMLNGNLAAQDFTAILLGDVSGNWDGVEGGGGEGEGGEGEGEPPVALTLPNVLGQAGGTVAVPLQIARGDAEVYALDLRLSYDASQLALLGVTAGAAADGVAWAANTSQPGTIRIGMASGSALSQNGDLLNLSFQVTGNLATPAAVSFQTASIDEGAVAAVLDPGYVADATPPAVAVQQRLTNDASPPLSGTVDDTLAGVMVTVAGTTYAASNRGDGTWFLNDNAISPPLADGTYDVQVRATDVLSRVGLDGTSNELTVDTLPPAVSGLSPAAGVAGVAVQPPLNVTFHETISKGSGTILLRKASDNSIVETFDVAGAGVSVSGTTATIVPSVTLSVLTDYYVEVAAGAFEDPVGNDFAGLSGAVAWNFTTETLQVAGLLPTPSGLSATINGPLEMTVLNLYDGVGGTLGAADVTVRDGAGNAVAGSLVADDNPRIVEWVATGNGLAPGTYTVTLKSGAAAFRDGEGHTLDGDADGTSGGDFGTQFTLAATDSRVVSLPDIARGAGQAVDVSGVATGWPLRISDGTGVTLLAVDVVDASALLNITAAAPAAGIAGDWSVNLDAGTPGVAKITASGTTPLSGTNVDVVRLTAAVPDIAPYGASQAIRLENVSLNGGTIAAHGDVAVHKAAYLGDVDGSGIHSAADAFLVLQAGLGLASGFSYHAWTDPRIVGDADGSTVLSAADSFLILQEGLGLVEPFVPDNPHITVTPADTGIDPQFQIGANLPASAGGLVSVPVKVDLDPGATNVGGLDFDLYFDVSQLTIDVPNAVTSGADTASGWSVSSTLVAAGHLRVGILNSRGQPLATGLREIARLQFRVDESAADGPAVLDIEPRDPRAGGYTWTASDGSLLIGPAPPALVISELMYNPASNEPDWEWVEVYNPGAVAVDMAGYVLDDNNATALTAANIASGTVPAHGTAVLFNADAISAEDLQAAWGAGVNLVAVGGWNVLSLGNSGDRVGLWRDFSLYRTDHVTHANTVDDVAFDDDGIVWPADDGAASIYLVDVSADNAVGGNWRLSQSGTAGAWQSVAAGGNDGGDVGSPGLVPGRWHNTTNPLDVNADGLVTPADVLTLINYVNLHPGGPALPAVAVMPEKYYDVDNDGACTARDVLATVNHLNGQAWLVAGGEGSGSSSAPTAAGDASPDELRDRFFRDLDTEWTPREVLFGDLADEIASG